MYLETEIICYNLWKVSEDGVMRRDPWVVAAMDKFTQRPVEEKGQPGHPLRGRVT